MPDTTAVFIFLLLIIMTISSSVAFIGIIRTMIKLEKQKFEIEKLTKENEQLKEILHSSKQKAD